MTGTVIVSWGRRLSISLAFHWQKRSRRGGYLYTSVLMVRGGAWECTLMTDHFMPLLLWPPVSGGGVFVRTHLIHRLFVSVLSLSFFKCSLPAHYGNKWVSSQRRAANEHCVSTLPAYYCNPYIKHKGFKKTFLVTMDFPFYQSLSLKWWQKLPIVPGDYITLRYLKTRSEQHITGL